MNYFELFEIPMQMRVDVAALRPKFLALSRTYHPDYFANSSETEQADALEKSAHLNKAFKTFSNFDATLQYVLTLKGMLVENEKYDLPPDFLMEMMELNEELAEAALDDDETVKKDLEARLNNLQNEWYAPVKHLIESTSAASFTEKELLPVKEYFFKKKYIARLKQQLQQKL